VRMPPNSFVVSQGNQTAKPLHSNLESIASSEEIESITNSRHEVVKCCSSLAEIAIQVRLCGGEGGYG